MSASLGVKPFGFGDPKFNEVMRLGLIATLRLAEDSAGRCWDAGQTGSVVRQNALEALSKMPHEEDALRDYIERFQRVSL